MMRLISPRRAFTARLVAIVTLVFALSACTPEQNAALDQINATRAEHGLSILVPSPQGMDKAQAWADHLAAVGSLSHSRLTDDMPEGWRNLGENVASGPTIDAAYQGLLKSPGHRANLLNPIWNWGATGIAQSANGTFYVVQVFAYY